MLKRFLSAVWRAALAAALMVTSLAIGAKAEESNMSGKVEGKIYTDWSVALEKSETAAGEDTMLVSHGFENQRAYFGYKLTIDEKFVGRVMLDVGRVKEVTKVVATQDTATGNVSAVSTSHDYRLEAYAKYAYLEIAGLIPKTSVNFGLRGRNQFGVQEKFWGYRYLYKSFMDANGYGSSADLGLGFSVKPVDQLTIYLDVDNGEGYKKLQMDTKYKASLGARVTPIGALDLYVYGDAMPTESGDSAAQYTLAGFAGVKAAKLFRIGVEYDFQGNNGGTEDATLNGVSAYATVAPFNMLEMFARFDLLSTDKYETYSKVIIGGIQLAPHKSLKIAPNVQVAIPAGDDPKPTTRILASGEFSF